MARPRVRHLAIFTRNPKLLRDFYMKVFDMDLVFTQDPHEAYFVSDGYLTLAILPHYLTGEHHTGLNHFGFHVEDVEQITKRLADFQIKPLLRPSDRPYAEHRGCDPDGNSIDLSEHGYERVAYTDETQTRKAKAS